VNMEGNKPLETAAKSGVGKMQDRTLGTACIRIKKMNKITTPLPNCDKQNRQNLGLKGGRRTQAKPRNSGATDR